MYLQTDFHEEYNDFVEALLSKIKTLLDIIISGSISKQSL